MYIGPSFFSIVRCFKVHSQPHQSPRRLENAFQHLHKYMPPRIILQYTLLSNYSFAVDFTTLQWPMLASRLHVYYLQIFEYTTFKHKTKWSHKQAYPLASPKYCPVVLYLYNSIKFHKEQLVQLLRARAGRKFLFIIGYCK